MELSTQIKQARAKLGLSQSQAAQAWGVPLRTLQAWEIGARNPSGLALTKLLEIIQAARSTAPPTPAASVPPTMTPMEEPTTSPKRIRPTKRTKPKG